MTITSDKSSKKIIILGNVASMMINFRGGLIKDLVKNNYQVYCLAKGYTKDDIQKITDWGAVAVESPLNSKGLNPFKDFIVLVKLFRIFGEIKPDIVFSYFVKPVIYGSFIAKLRGTKRIIGMIEGLGNGFSQHKTNMPIKSNIIKIIQIILYKITLRFLNVLILLNNDDKKDLIDKYNIKVKKVIVLGGIGLDLNKFDYSIVNENKNISFIFIARLLKEKGIFEYLEAASKIKKIYPEIEFKVLGSFDVDNPYALKETELNEYLSSETIIYPGFVTNVDEWIRESSVFVLPSYYREGVPRSTQEAMAIGRPIITTDSVGCRETVIDGLNGFLIPPLSSDVLIEKMLFFIQNKQVINIMGCESRKLAEKNYDMNTINIKLIELIGG